MTQSHISELKFACKDTVYIITFIIQIWICIQIDKDLLNFFFRKLISQSFGDYSGKGNSDFIQYSFLQIIVSIYNYSNIVSKLVACTINSTVFESF